VRLSWFWIVGQALRRLDLRFRRISQCYRVWWAAQICVIEQVEDFGAELDVEALRNSPVGMFLNTEKSSEVTPGPIRICVLHCLEG